MRRFVRIVTFALLSIVASGCKSVTEGAREHFSKDFTCPLDRVEVRPRPDIRPSDFEKPSDPPKEIADDPGRLKMWKANQDERKSWANSRDDILEARGCGHQRLYACHRHNKDKNYVMCS